ncbi:hypothetical protein J3A83DRAFT_4437100 [Scleroderma citrinum]
MQSLPPKPDFPALDDRRTSGGRSSPDRYYPRDDRRDQRSYRPRDQPRSPRPIMMDSYIADSPLPHPDTGSPPPPPRDSSPHPPQRDSWVPGSSAHRDHHHGRDHRSYEDSRTIDDRGERRPMWDRRGSGRSDHWTPDRGRDRDRDRDNDRRDGDYRRGPNYSGRRRPFPKYDSRDRDRDRDGRRRYPSPDYRRDSRSPPSRRGDHYSGRGHSPVRRHAYHSPPHGHRSPSPYHAQPDRASELGTPRHDRDRTRERRSISPPRRRRYSRSPSPYRRPPRPRSPSQTRLRPSSPRYRSPSPTRQVDREPLDEPGLGDTDERHRASSPLPHVRKEGDDEEIGRGLSPHRHGIKDGASGESTHVQQRLSPPPLSSHTHARPRSFSPTVSEKEREREKERQVEKKPTQPYLPVIPRYNPGPSFSKTLLVSADYDRLDAYRAHVATEQCKAGKAWRRAQHELEMATLELKTAQHRRELVESLRKRAHAGVLGIDAVPVQEEAVSL